MVLSRLRLELYSFAKLLEYTLIKHSLFYQVFDSLWPVLVLPQNDPNLICAANFDQLQALYDKSKMYYDINI